jgi:hypothetical protein
VGQQKATTNSTLGLLTFFEIGGLNIPLLGKTQPNHADIFSHISDLVREQFQRQSTMH